MPLVKQLPKTKQKQCKHQHVNGNRCGSRVEVGIAHKGSVYCVPHERQYEKCETCYSMLRSFQPRAGW